MPKIKRIESIDFYNPNITVFTIKNCLAVIEQYKLPPKKSVTVYFRKYKKKMTVEKLVSIIQHK